MPLLSCCLKYCYLNSETALLLALLSEAEMHFPSCSLQILSEFLVQRPLPHAWLEMRVVAWFSFVAAGPWQRRTF